MNWWSKLADDNKDLVKYVPSIGKSFEGRDQPAVHITASVEPEVKKIYFQCQIHASMCWPLMAIIIGPIYNCCPASIRPYECCPASKAVFTWLRALNWVQLVVKRVPIHQWIDVG